MNPSSAPLPQGQTVSFAVTLIIFTTNYMSERKTEFQRTETITLDAEAVCLLFMEQRLHFDGRYFDITRLELDDTKTTLKGAASCAIDEKSAKARRIQTKLIKAGWTRSGLTVIDGGLSPTRKPRRKR